MGSLSEKKAYNVEALREKYEHEVLYFDEYLVTEKAKAEGITKNVKDTRTKEEFKMIVKRLKYCEAQGHETIQLTGTTGQEVRTGLNDLKIPSDPTEGERVRSLPRSEAKPENVKLQEWDREELAGKKVRNFTATIEAQAHDEAQRIGEHEHDPNKERSRGGR